MTDQPFKGLTDQDLKESMPLLTTAQQVIADIEAHRNTTAEVRLEDELSIFDWMERVKQAAKHAGQLARQEDAMLQYHAWVELGSIVCARAEQVLRSIARNECEHQWPADLEPHSACLNGCGLMYGEWSQ